MYKNIIVMSIASASVPPWVDVPDANLEKGKVDNMKPNMSFYQSRMHRTKKGGKVNFK